MAELALRIKTALWARLYDGERAHSIYKGYLQSNVTCRFCRFTLLALIVHSTDGSNYRKSLVQSHEEEIVFTCCLKSGRVVLQSVRVRGGFELAIRGTGEITRLMKSKAS
jgi:hypothetical protein